MARKELHFLRLHVDQAWWNLPCTGVLQILKEERYDSSVAIAANHTTANSFHKQLVYPHAQHGAVFQIVSFGADTTDFITHFHRPCFDIKAQAFEFFVNQVVDDV